MPRHCAWSVSCPNGFPQKRKEKQEVKILLVHFDKMQMKRGKKIYLMGTGNLIHMRNNPRNHTADVDAGASVSKTEESITGQESPMILRCKVKE